MIKIWNEAFWKDAPAGERQPDRAVPLMMIIPSVALAVGTVFMGLFPGVFIDLALRAADQLTDPAAYIEAVLQPAAPIPESP
jgi:multicomponent Na+:H+ antiporter subunit D